MDVANATRSNIVSPQVLPLALRSKFSTLIGDVATSGQWRPGVFDPNHKCLLGIVSQKIFSHTAQGDKDIAKYFVPAGAIRDFMPAEFWARIDEPVVKRKRKSGRVGVDAPPTASIPRWRGYAVSKDRIGLDLANVRCQISSDRGGSGSFGS